VSGGHFREAHRFRGQNGKNLPVHTTVVGFEIGTVRRICVHVVNKFFIPYLGSCSAEVIAESKANSACCCVCIKIDKISDLQRHLHVGTSVFQDHTELEQSVSVLVVIHAREDHGVKFFAMRTRKATPQGSKFQRLMHTRDVREYDDISVGAECSPDTN
jgi:hypothetical protein